MEEGDIPPTVLIVEKDDRHEVRLPSFEGPLDLLLHLIRKQEIDIYDIPMALVTEQYLLYLGAMEDLDVSVAGEFLEMAANLIYIKSKMLLPPDPVADSVDAIAEDPRRELVERLLEYETFKNAAQLLYSKQEVELGSWNVSRLREVVPDDEELVSVTLLDVLSSFRNVMKRMEDRRVVEMERESFSVVELIRHLQAMLRERKVVRFSALVQGVVSRLYVVVLFVALLEMARMEQVALRQDGQFSDILITRKGLA